MALLFVYFFSTSAILMGATTSPAQAWRGGRGGGRGFYGGGGRGWRGRGFYAPRAYISPRCFYNRWDCPGTLTQPEFGFVLPNRTRINNYVNNPLLTWSLQPPNNWVRFKKVTCFAVTAKHSIARSPIRVVLEIAIYATALLVPLLYPTILLHPGP
jgi:hypothetical protein